MIRSALVATVLLSITPAHAEPSDRDLFYTGLALVPPTYLLGVTLHEGSHALMAEIVGGDVISVHLFPPGIDPRVNKFRFGWVYARGLVTPAQKQLFHLAPKITDTLLLGGFSALVFTNAWPDNRYGRLALTTFATGLWVDFAKDLLLFSPTNDVSKVFKTWCMTGWRQIPARLVYGAAVVGLGYVVWRGYERTFPTFEDDPEASARTVSMPVWSSVF